MSDPKKNIALEARFEGESELVIDAVNRSAQPLTMVALPRYFKIEVENVLGQFVNGASEGAPAAALPAARDYKTIAPGARETLLRLPVLRSEDSRAKTAIGDEVFRDLPAKWRARVTYRATDRVMPNLPRDKQRSFFIGPVDTICGPA